GRTLGGTEIVNQRSARDRLLRLTEAVYSKDNRRRSVTPTTICPRGLLQHAPSGFADCYPGRRCAPSEPGKQASLASPPCLARWPPFGVPPRVRDMSNLSSRPASGSGSGC